METDEIYFNLFSEFKNRKVRYLIVGGYAAILYGANRMTKDMDLVVDLSVRNLTKCIDILKRNSFVLSHQYIKEDEINPENIIKWKKEKNMKALRFEHIEKQFIMVDVILDIYKKFNLLYKNKKCKHAGRNTLYFISKRDLVEMKSNAGRIQDYQDNFSITGEAKWLDKLKERYSIEKER